MDKIGVGHLRAMGEKGLEELRNGVYPESNVADHSSYGLYGASTPGEKADIRREANEEPQSSVMAEWARSTEHGPDREDRTQELEPER